MPTPMTIAMEELKPKLALDGDEPEPQLTIMTLKDYSDMKNSLKENYGFGFVDGVIAASIVYLVLTLVSVGIYYAI